MKNSITEQIKKYIKEQRQRHRWITMRGVLAVIVVIATITSLVLPAFTLETKETDFSGATSEPAQASTSLESGIICGFEEHLHSDECYETTTALACDRQEIILHTHTDECYEEDRNGDSYLICGEVEVLEHDHDDESYVLEHEHDDECYEKVLICELDEHEHSDECCAADEEDEWEEEAAETEHTSECYDEDGNLICENPDHAAQALAAPADIGFLSADISLISGSCETDCTYELLKNEDGTEYELKITGTGEEGSGTMSNFTSYGTNIAPWSSYNNLITSAVITDGVEYIGEYAFYNCVNLKDVTIPDSVTSIGINVFFYCSSLASVTIPDSVTSISNGMFYYCTSLSSIIMGDVTSIGNNAFYGCTSLTSIELPSGVESIGYNAFYGCRGLSSINIPGSVVSIGNNAFTSCTSLKSIELPDSITSIGSSAFMSCTGLTSITLPPGLTSIGDTVFYKCSSLTSMTIPGSVTSIGSSAFYECTGLTSIELPSGVKSIGQSAFSGCTGLTSMTIPESVESIGNNAFSSCTGLTSMTVPNNVTSIGSSAFSGCTGLTSITLPSGLTSIGDYLVYRCTGLTSIDIPSGVTSIGNGAFNNCTGLTSITLPFGLKSIGQSAFQSCTNLTSINMPSGVTSIGAYAFQYCTNLASSIDIPSGVTSIEYSAFYGCNSLPSITIPESVTSIASYAFYGCYSLTNIIIPSSVTSLGDSTFAGCISLTSATILNNIIGNHQFYACTKLKNVTITGSVTRIEDYAFRSCTGLKSVTFSEDAKSSLKSIGNNAFLECTSLPSITIPDSVTSIGTNTFYNCYSLASVNIPSGVTSIEANTFYNCYSLTNITYNAANLTAFTASALTGVNSYDIIVGKNVDVLPSAATTLISNARNLKFEGPNVFTLKSGVLASKNYPFSILDEGDYYADSYGALYRLDAVNNDAYLAYCPPGITSYTIPASIAYDNATYAIVGVDSSALNLASGLESLTFEAPESIVTIASSAFANCTTLTSINGEYAIDEILSLLSAAAIGDRAFYNTGLDGDGVTPNGGETKNTLFYGENDENSKNLFLEFKLSSAGEAERDQSTGVVTTLTDDVINLAISAHGSGTESGTESVFRVYLDFSNAGFHVSPGLGTASYSGTGANDIQVTTAQSGVPGIYYLEFSLKEGDTFYFNISLSYPNVFSGGGSVNVWGEILEGSIGEKGGEVSFNEDGCMRAVWKTKADPFTLTKANATSNVALKGDGTDSGIANLNKEISFTIKYTRQSTSSNYGKDYIRSVDYEDVFTLPNGMYWKPEVLEAVDSGNYRVNTSFVSGTTYRINFYAIIDGEEYRFAYLTYSNSTTGAMRNPDVEVDGDNLCFKWTLLNTLTTSEISTGDNTTLFIAETSLCVDLKEDTYNITTAQTIKNTVSSVAHYTYSGEKPNTSEVSLSIAVPTATPAFTNVALDLSSDTTPNSLYYGAPFRYRVRLENTGALLCIQTEDIIDTMTKDTFITAANMETMFKEEFGEILTIELQNASLYDTKDWGKATAMDGKTVVETNPSNSDATAKTTTASITIKWDDTGKNLVMTVAADSGTTDYTIGDGCDYDSIQAALNGIGYVVNNAVQYKLTWNISKLNNAAGLTVYGGQIHDFYIYASCKSEFQHLQSDYLNYYIYSYNYNIARTTLPDSSGASSPQVHTAVYTAFRIAKSVSINGSTASNPTFGSVIDNKITVTHYGGGSNDVLPLVDDSYGAQVLLVPVEKNKDRPWVSSNGYDSDDKDDIAKNIYTDSDGTKYYILHKAYEYKGVWVGVDQSGAVCYADTVTVVGDASYTPEYSGDSTIYTYGRHTEIKWYYSDLPTGTYTKTMTYKTLIWVDSVDDIKTDDFTFQLSNAAWLNDRKNDRLYDYYLLKSYYFDFGKDIVVSGAATSDEQLAGDKHSIVSQGETVVYRLEVVNLNNISLSFSTVYDILPNTFGLFEWTKDNVEVEYQLLKSDGTRGDLTATDIYYTWELGTKITTEGTQINWKSFLVPANSTMYFYVYLTFPSTEDGNNVWSEYCSASSSYITNTLFVNGRHEDVTHELKQPAKAYLQKGIFATGRFARGYMEQFGTRLNYSDSDAYTRFVTYYTTIYNAGNTSLYLTELQDTLPDGFTFFGFPTTSRTWRLFTYNTENEVYGSYYESVSASYYESSAKTLSSELVQLTDGNRGDISYPGYKVTADTTTPGKVTFKFSNTGYSGLSLSYDSSCGLYYLKPGQAITIQYFCTVASGNVLPDVATNTVAMPYYDYNGAGVEAATGVTVKASKNSYISDSNDGTHALWSAAAAQANGFSYSGSTQWLSSKVDIIKEQVIPGITKTVVSSTPENGGTALPYTNGLSTTDWANWKLTLFNNGNSSMIDYTIVETMEAPYVFSGDITFSMYRSASAQRGKLISSFAIERNKSDLSEITVKIGAATYNLTRGAEPTEIKFTYDVYNNYYGVSTSNRDSFTATAYLRFYLDADGNEVMELRMADSCLSIPERHYAEMTFSTRNLTTKYTYTVFTNKAVLVPSQTYAGYTVSQGINLVENGENAGVLSSAPINVIAGAATSSSKSVTENSNTAKSDDTQNYIVLSGKKSEFTYTLNVINDTSTTSDVGSFNTLVFVDNLPESGDHATFSASDPRGSAFKVSLAVNPNFSVYMTKDNVKKEIDPKYYEIQYSDKTEFINVNGGDWTASYKDGWYELPSTTTRSFRVIIDADNESSVMPAGCTVTVSFDAVIEGEADAGTTAWNSFGYRYSRIVTAGSATYLEASPIKVGVMVSSVPKLQKKLVDSHSTVYAAGEDTEFTFLIHEGSALGEYSDPQTVYTALSTRKVTLAKVTVKAGMSESDLLVLEDLNCYKVVDGQWSKDDISPWTWTTNSSYTIVELDGDETYSFKSMNGKTAEAFNFTYQNSSNLLLTCVNTKATYDLTMKKIENGTETVLPDAVFGIYSANQRDAITDKELEEAEEAYGVTLTGAEQITVTEAVEGDKEQFTYYLMSVKETDGSGLITWRSLDSDVYYVVELKAPSGYMKRSDPIKVTKGATDSITLTVDNYTKIELPKSGGSGIYHLAYLGILLMAAAVGLMYGKLRRQKEERDV